MKNREFLKKTQPIYYRILERSSLTNHLSHAYLLVGEQSDVASLFLEQTLMCLNDNLACEECANCKRIEKEIHPDLIIFDGKDKSIKKENIEYIQNNFMKYAVEGNKKIYVLKNVENSSISAMNSLLKFLEEPVSNVHAILTTNNENQILPTIRSRCQIIHLLPESKESIRFTLISNDIDEEDSNVLSELYNSYDICKSVYESEDYLEIKKYVFNFIEDLYTNPSNTLIDLQLTLMKKYKGDKNNIKLFLNMLVLGLRDVFHVKHNIKPLFIKHQEFFEQLKEDKNILEKIEIVLDTINNIEVNANLSLLIDSMVYKIMKGVTNG